MLEKKTKQTAGGRRGEAALAIRIKHSRGLGGSRYIYEGSYIVAAVAAIALYMRGASSRCGCHRYRHPSSPPPPRRTSERRTNRALECGFPREEECEGHQQGGNRRDRTRAYATTLKMPRGLLAGLPRGLRERAQPEGCRAPLPFPPLPLEAGLSFSFNVFITPCSRVRRSYTPKQSSCIALYSPPSGSWVEEES